MAKISLENIAHSYSANSNDLALKPLTHDWEDGGAYALLGPSGCGKTTLLNIISGLLLPTRGRLCFDGIDVSRLPTEQRNIAQVFQFPVIYDTMTVAENLAFPLRNRRGSAKLDNAEIRRRVGQALEMLELESVADRKARGLSADDKQKISLGRGLVRTDVNAILFDEPLTVIDPHQKWQLRTRLKQIHRQFGHTMIYVTHDQTEALTFADQVVVMLNGEVLQTGTPEALFLRPAHTFVGSFIGSPGMNILPCYLAGDHAEVAGFRVPLGAVHAAGQGLTELGVRPEFVRFSPDGMPVAVQSMEDTGRHRIVRVSLGACLVNLMLREGQEIPAEPRIGFDLQHTLVYRNGRLATESLP